MPERLLKKYEYKYAGFGVSLIYTTGSFHYNSEVQKSKSADSTHLIKRVRMAIQATAQGSCESCSPYLGEYDAYSNLTRNSTCSRHLHYA